MALAFWQVLHTIIYIFFTIMHIWPLDKWEVYANITKNKTNLFL